MCDGPRNTALMMPSSISHCCLEGAEEEMRNQIYCEDGLFGCGDEVKVSRVSEERRTSGMASEVCMDN